MEITELKNDIQHNTLKQFYIFTGDEWKVQDIYITQMSKLFDRKVYIDSITDILNQLKLTSIIKQKTLYIVRDDAVLMKDETLQSKLSSLLAENTLVLLVSSVDKRTKFYKTYSSSFVEFSTLEHAVLKRYVKREINLSDKNIELLMELCEYNYGRCLLEIDKIKKCMKGTDADDMPNNTFEMLVADGTIYEPPYDAVFDFVDEVLKRHATRAFNLLAQCYAVNESTLVLLSVLYNNAKQTLQVQSCTSSDIESTTGLTKWQIKCAKEKTGYYSNRELVNMLKLIQTVEKGIKTGQMEEMYAMQYVLANVL